jgi:hypothetical protein
VVEIERNGHKRDDDPGHRRDKIDDKIYSDRSCRHFTPAIGISDENLRDVRQTSNYSSDHSKIAALPSARLTALFFSVCRPYADQVGRDPHLVVLSRAIAHGMVGRWAWKLTSHIRSFMNIKCTQRLASFSQVSTQLRTISLPSCTDSGNLAYN